jgi:HK97 family phage prohead protease
MLWGGVANGGALELRRDANGGARLTGRFPYGSETDLAPGRAEVIEPRAFAARIDAKADIHLLAGHDYEKPLASRAAGTLSISDTPEGVIFEARIDPGTTWARDFLAAHAAGLVRGLSPGFRVGMGGERVEKRGNGLLRRIMAADLFELSAVTVPAYPDAQIEARNWRLDGAAGERVRQLFAQAEEVHLPATYRRWRL